jgi:nucleoside-diphosphate-sugar epimerase
MKKILITGVTGFIGSNLVRYFNSQNDFVIFGHSRDGKRASVQFENAHVEMIETYSAAILNDRKINAIIHLAGIAHDLSNQYQPDDYDLVNYGNTKVLFDEFVKSNTTKFVFLSSIKAAIDTSPFPADESIAPSPVTEYGKSKRKAEKYVLSNPLVGGKKVYILRPCMIHGLGNKGNLNLLYRYAKTGFPFPFGSFENRRSFLSIDNLNFMILSIIEKDIPSGIFHVADEGDMSTKELYKLIVNEIGKTPKVWNLPTGFVRLLFSLVGKKAMLDKLTENMLVSNNKILQYIDSPLPVEMHKGLKKTISSFNGK